MSSTAEKIVSGLGGRDNISDLEPCITRLRVEVEDQEKVDEDALRAAGAFGVVRSGRVVQVVVGPTADDLASEIAALDREPRAEPVNHYLSHPLTRLLSRPLNPE